MLRRGQVYSNDVFAGVLSKSPEGIYTFTYNDDYFANPECPAISLTLPKSQQSYQSTTLFPFFFGLLSEGTNKQTQCGLFKIDERDYFSLLLETAHTDTIGAITVKEDKL